MSKLLFIPCFVLLVLSNLLASDVFDQEKKSEEIPIENISASDSQGSPQLYSEKIDQISSSGRVIIISNENHSFNKGDFVSLIVKNTLVCRTIVAKVNEDAPMSLSGIKIVKIYNQELLSTLGPRKDVLVLKGDDSSFNKKNSGPVSTSDDGKDSSKIKSEDDLYNSTTLSESDDESLNGHNKRLLKQDNLIAVNAGLITSRDINGANAQYSHINFNWGYQVADNIFAEFQIGTNTIVDYPDVGIDTRLTAFELRAKYTFAAPMYSYIQPYVGYQVVTASSPGAGTPDGRTPDQIQLALSMVEDLKKTTPVVGVTFLKRLVPGWFIRLDLGTDILNAGLSIEF